VIASAAEVETIRAIGIVLAALVTAVGGIVVALWRTNKREHAENGGKLDQLVKGQSEIKADLADVKADVRELKATDRDHEHRIEALEPHPTPKPRTTRKKAS
jgi:hypothetical protein